MSDRLQRDLAIARREIEAGLAEAEAELARLRQRCRETEELIANGKTVFLSSHVSEEVGVHDSGRGGPAPERSVDGPSLGERSAPDFAAGLRDKLRAQARGRAGL